MPEQSVAHHEQSAMRFADKAYQIYFDLDSDLGAGRGVATLATAHPFSWDSFQLDDLKDADSARNDEGYHPLAQPLPLLPR